LFRRFLQPIVISGQRLDAEAVGCDSCWSAFSVSGGIEFHADDGRVSHCCGAGRQGGLEIEIGEELRSICRQCARLSSVGCTHPGAASYSIFLMTDVTYGRYFFLWLLFFRWHRSRRSLPEKRRVDKRSASTYAEIVMVDALRLSTLQRHNHF